MQRLFVYLIAGAVLAVLFVFGLSQLNDAKAQRLRAEAVVIRAQGQSRMDTATAVATMVIAALPWGMMLLAVIGSGFVIVMLLKYAPPTQTNRERIIERTVYVCLPARADGQPNWRQLGHTVERIEAESGGRGL